MVVGAGVVETPSVVVASGVVVMASVVSTVVISAKNTRESCCLIICKFDHFSRFFALTRLKIFAATMQKMEKTQLDELYIYVNKSFLLK